MVDIAVVPVGVPHGADDAEGDGTVGNDFVDGEPLADEILADLQLGPIFGIYQNGMLRNHARRVRLRMDELGTIS